MLEKWIFNTFKELVWASSFQTSMDRTPIFIGMLSFIAWMTVLKFHGNMSTGTKVITWKHLINTIFNPFGPLVSKSVLKIFWKIGGAHLQYIFYQCAKFQWWGMKTPWVLDYTKKVPPMCCWRTNERSGVAPRPAFAFGDTGKNVTDGRTDKCRPLLSPSVPLHLIWHPFRTVKQ